MPRDESIANTGKAASGSYQAAVLFAAARKRLIPDNKPCRVPGVLSVEGPHYKSNERSYGSLKSSGLITVRNMKLPELGL